MNPNHYIRRARTTSRITILAMFLGCGLALIAALGGYRQTESHQMRNTATLALEGGLAISKPNKNGGASVSFPEHWPPDCRNDLIPLYKVCAASKNIVIDAAHPASDGFEVPFASNDWTVRSTWGTVSYIPSTKNTTLAATVYGGSLVLFRLTIDVDSERRCLTRIDPPTGPRGDPYASCSGPIVQIIYEVNHPDSHIRIVLDNAGNADGSTLSLNLNFEYWDPPPGIPPASKPVLASETVVKTGCSKNISGKEICTDERVLPWGECASGVTSPPQDGLTKVTFTATIREVQRDAQLAKCFAVLSRQMFITSIHGKLGYAGGGPERASMNFWLYVDQDPGTAECCGDDIIYGAKIAVPRMGTECIVRDPNPDPQKKACIIPIEGTTGKPIVFFRPIPARKLTLWFNSDLDSAHPDRDHPDIITLTLFLRTSVR